jgi:hypothetical protein
MKELALCLWWQKKNDEALELCREALAGLEKERGADDQISLPTMSLLGSILRSTGNLRNP